jgi:hypothetical protein
MQDLNELFYVVFVSLGVCMILYKGLLFLELGHPALRALKCKSRLFARRLQQVGLNMDFVIIDLCNLESSYFR